MRLKDAVATQAGATGTFVLGADHEYVALYGLLLLARWQLHSNGLGFRTRMHANAWKRMSPGPKHSFVDTGTTRSVDVVCYWSATAGDVGL